MPRWNSLVSLFVRSKPYLALLLWAGVPLLVSSEQHSLMGHDEGWYAQQARWIVESGDWVTQQWWGEPIYDRAMGIQWAIALAYTLFGISDRVARLPGVLACFAAILLLYDIARRCVPERIAWFSAAILAATPIWMQAGRLATQDVPLTAIELLGMWALVRAESHPECQAGWRWLAGTTFGLGFAVKSFMVVLAGVALLPYLVGERGRHRHLRSPALCVGLVMGFIPVAIWLGLSCDRYGTLPLEKPVRASFSALAR
ncbi:MAG: glycosyltransferase family 39 protein [Cyanobacteria bacterium J06639_1]